MNNPFDYIPHPDCDEAFRLLSLHIEELKKSKRQADINFCRELEAGKMLGVLIAEDSAGKSHTLYAFSGQLGDGGFYFPGFVRPVFDYLQPSGYFKTRAAAISRQNTEIAKFEKETLSKIRLQYAQAKKLEDAEISEYKEKCRLSKLKRNSRRETGIADEAELQDMIRQSQFEKAELHRLKKRAEASLSPLATQLKEAEDHLEGLKKKRHSDSEALQKWLFDNFLLLNASGEKRSLSEIFAETPLMVPPSGAGECCAPKLLQTAYMQGLNPVAIAEYWYGAPKGGEVRLHGNYYPACRGKCLPILDWMLQGLSIYPPINSDRNSKVSHCPEVIFENRWFCVVNKPSGMLSVPGKGNAISLQKWLEQKYGADRQVKVAHRLDQDTSGLLIATFGPLSYKIMQSLFAMRKVNKTYVAELDGNLELRGVPLHGHIDLPLSPDWLDRPRQRVDLDAGKEALTEYEFIGMHGDRSRVMFHPRTGRTHQLRVHAASQQGLGIPIAGDRLYGKNSGGDVQRLLLHAQGMEFSFPIDGRHYSFESPIPF